MAYLDNLEWRFATKKFDTNKELDDKSLEKILKAIRFAPTSFGLQPFHVVVVKNNALRKKMKLASFLQDQVSDASYLLVFCARTDIKDRIDKYIEMASHGSTLAKIKLEPKKLAMKASASKKSSEELLEWSRRQTYIALGFALAACTELKVDSCPMEGFMNGKIDKILNLPDHISSVAYLALGYRNEDEAFDKIRFEDDDLFSWKK